MHEIKAIFRQLSEKIKEQVRVWRRNEKKDIFIGDQTSWTTVNSNCKPTSNILMLTCKMPRVHSHTWYRIYAQKSKYANRCCLCHWESFASLYNVIFLRKKQIVSASCVLDSPATIYLWVKHARVYVCISIKNKRVHWRIVNLFLQISCIFKLNGTHCASTSILSSYYMVASVASLAKFFESSK